MFIATCRSFAMAHQKGTGQGMGPAGEQSLWSPCPHTPCHATWGLNRGRSFSSNIHLQLGCVTPAHEVVVSLMISSPVVFLSLLLTKPSLFPNSMLRFSSRLPFPLVQGGPWGAGDGAGFVFSDPQLFLFPVSLPWKEGEGTDLSGCDSS